MNFNYIIIGLIIAIVICLVFMTIISIRDARKKKEEKVVNVTDEIKSSNVSEEIKETNENKTKIEETSDKSCIDNDEVNKELDTENKDLSDDKDSLNDEYTNKISSIENTVDESLNPKPVKSADDNLHKVLQADTKVAGTELALTTGQLEDACKQLLELVATELSKKKQNPNDLLIHYFNDDMPELVNKGEWFDLPCTEIVENGILRVNEDRYYLHMGSRVTIKFCVNFSLPEGYSIQLVEDTAKLEEKGLVLHKFFGTEATSSSLRAICVTEKDCVIDKEECLFRVHILKEVVQ